MSGPLGKEKRDELNRAMKGYVYVAVYISEDHWAAGKGDTYIDIHDSLTVGDANDMLSRSVVAILTGQARPPEPKAAN